MEGGTPSYIAKHWNSVSVLAQSVHASERACANGSFCPVLTNGIQTFQ